MRDHLQGHLQCQTGARALTSPSQTPSASWRRLLLVYSVTEMSCLLPKTVKSGHITPTPNPHVQENSSFIGKLDTGFHGHKQSLASLQRICGPVRWHRRDLCLKCPAPYLRVGTHGTRGPETEQFQSKAIQTDSQTAAPRGYGADSVSDPPSPSSFVSKVGSVYLSRVVVSIKPDNGFKKQPCGE